MLYFVSEQSAQAKWQQVIGRSPRDACQLLLDCEHEPLSEFLDILLDWLAAERRAGLGRVSPEFRLQFQETFGWTIHGCIDERSASAMCEALAAYSTAQALAEHLVDSYSLAASPEEFAAAVVRLQQVLDGTLLATERWLVITCSAPVSTT